MSKNTWAYRVVKRGWKRPGVEEIEYTYAIHEVHMTDGKIHSIAIEPTNVQAESKESVLWMLQKMLEAAAKPVISYEEPFEETT